jgi:glycosyltransferase involved in cell wall biosynthesis
MKICIFDHLGGHKTTKELEKWLSTHGHEVKWNMYYDMREIDTHIGWCDLAVFEWFEGAVSRCLKDGWGDKKPIYVRAMDIEVWANNNAGFQMWDGLAGLGYTSKYIFENVFKENHQIPETLKTAHLPLSIDMNDWKFNDNNNNGYNIGVLGHMWDSKGPNFIPQFARYLIDKTKTDKWKFYVQGNWRHDVWKWYLYYFKHIVKELGLENNIILNEERVNDINTWYDQINYLVTFSMKDAFSIPVAEAMAKGIKALPHNFPGSKDIWGEYVWSTFDELFDKMINQSYEPLKYHNYVKERYSNEVIMKKWEQFLNL